MKGFTFLFVCNYAAQYSGNFIASMSELMRELNEENDVAMLLPEGASGKHWLSLLPIASDKLFFCDFSPRSLYLTCKHLRAKIKSERIITHTHFVDNFAFLAVRLAMSKVVCHYHMTVPQCTTWRRKIRRLVNNFIYKDCIICGVSEPVSNDLRKYFCGSVVECVTNAISFSHLEKDEDKHLFGKTSKKVLLIHGTHFFRKGVDLALRAVQMLNEKFGNIYIYITSHHVEETRSLARDFADADYYSVIPVVEDVKNLYGSVDFFLSPSREEAFGYAVVEAAYCGCTVIASDIPGQDTMKNIPSVIWVEPESVDALGTAIWNVCNAVAKSQQEDDAYTIRRAITENYDISRWVEKMLSIYAKYYVK